MSDEPVKWMISVSADNFMGLNVVWVYRKQFYRWYYRRPLSIERMEL